MIYTWDGDGFSFLTDVLGVSPLGASSGDGQFFPTDHQEFVLRSRRIAEAKRWRV